MFENDERFNAVERPRDREDLFESYMVELERKVIICYFMITYEPFVSMAYHFSVVFVPKEAA